MSPGERPVRREPREGRRFQMNFRCKFEHRQEVIDSVIGQAAPDDPRLRELGLNGKGRCIDTFFYGYFPEDKDGNNCCVEALYEIE